MKKIILFSLILSLIITGGCKKKNDDFFIKYNNISDSSFDDANVKEYIDFFAKDLVIVTASENRGDDESITSTSSLLINVTDKELTYADNVYQKIYPASLTKLVTALVVLKRGELTDNVTVSYNASHITEPGAKVCGFKEGDNLTLETLLNAFMVYSGNDAGVAISEHLAGSEEAFVELMNEEAKNLGALKSNFVNSHGLHNDNHYTTAYDMYLIFNELIKYDAFVNIINQSSYTAKYFDKNNNSVEKEFQTTNGYLNGKFTPLESITVIGGKTGYTSKAGNCLILLVKDNDGKNYISLLLHSSSSNDLYQQMNTLLSKIN